MHALVTADQLVGEGQAWHQSALLKPEDGAERTREEDTLDGSEGDKSLGIWVLRVNPFQSPLCLLGRDWDIRNGLEEEVLFLSVVDVGVNQQ